MLFFYCRMTALVLSGGGLFGAYQAGAWRALERVIRPDLIVGASVGALNGWCIASGLSADGLIQRWLAPQAGDLMRFRFPAWPWQGFFDARPLRDQARTLVRELKPRIECA